MMHIMLDLETYGVRPGSVIRSIGAVTFDPNDVMARQQEFYVNVDHDSCMEAGLTVDHSTFLWWQSQSAEAKELVTKDAIPLADAMKLFRTWFNSVGGEKVWCQGANFDAVLLEAAMLAAKQYAPWKFYNVRDTRTVYDLAGFDTSTIERVGVHHYAVDDCKHQIKCVHAAIEKMVLDAMEVEDAPQD